ncbi:MAG: hypothetical protein HN742_34820 [Lentisphaerae bacterium]|nr:hypothetical protein [Lentisphaerota bacterium]MBT4817276.1 hypothetical protein [Lentisphaerota bacterium]MBT5612984.1 hypothetical protein [Lentisphaerota bacterium]MBT7059062.1 hypothetical protein [Lentisphaerota bacterium]MBT7847096.1 hypothetical protein [Lentisphaerota bacterium]
MYALSPLKVYALDRALDDAVCVERMERMLRAMDLGPDDVITITESNLSAVAAEIAELWPPTRVPDGKIGAYTRPIIFTTIDFNINGTDLRPLLSKCAPGTSLDILNAIYGQFGAAIDQHPHERDRRENCVCWPTYNVGTVRGCSHGCLYCGSGRAGKFLAIGLNLEDYMEKVVGPAIESYPWNRVFRMILSGDPITLEPEYGLHDLFSRKLSEFDDRYGHFHTGSANVEWLAELPHKDRLVGVWSVPCETVARQMEPGSASGLERIEAGRKCNDMGIPVRYKLKPIIPVRNWREEYADLLKQAVTVSRPESIGFCLYIWNSFESMTATLPVDLLDPECLEAARQAAPEMQGVRTGPFPHATRKMIYQHMIREVRRWDKDVKLYVSTETREMWDDLAAELGQDPKTYVCGCSSVAVPGGTLGANPGLKYSTYCPTPA